MLVVRLRNKSKGLPSYATRARRTKIWAIQQRQNEKKIVWGRGRNFCRYKQLGGRIVVEENNVDTMLKFNKEKGDED